MTAILRSIVGAGRAWIGAALLLTTGLLIAFSAGEIRADTIKTFEATTGIYDGPNHGSFCCWSSSITLNETTMTVMSFKSFGIADGPLSWSENAKIFISPGGSVIISETFGTYGDTNIHWQRVLDFSLDLINNNGFSSGMEAYCQFTTFCQNIWFNRAPLSLVSMTVTPLPGAILLFSSCLVAIGFLRRRLFRY